MPEALRLSEVTCRRAGRSLFQPLSFSLSEGANLFLKGVNGSGKSSLLRLLAGLLPTESGGVFWQGQKIDLRSEEHANRQLLIGHQSGMKPALTILENLLFWWRLFGGQDEIRISQALHHFGLSPLRHQAFRNLSAGQKRRASLARLCLRDCPLWLLDEPTANLDREGKALLDHLIAMHNRTGGVTILATHEDLSFPGHVLFLEALPERVAP